MKSLICVYNGHKDCAAPQCSCDCHKPRARVVTSIYVATQELLVT